MWQGKKHLTKCLRWNCEFGKHTLVCEQTQCIRPLHLREILLMTTIFTGHVHIPMLHMLCDRKHLQFVAFLYLKVFSVTAYCVTENTFKYKNVFVGTPSLENVHSNVNKHTGSRSLHDSWNTCNDHDITTYCTLVHIPMLHIYATLYVTENPCKYKTRLCWNCEFRKTYIRMWTNTVHSSITIFVKYF